MGQLSRLDVPRRDYSSSVFAQHSQVQVLEVVGTDISVARADCCNFCVRGGERMAWRSPRKLANFLAERGGLFLHRRERNDNSKAKDSDTGRSGILPNCYRRGTLWILRRLSRRDVHPQNQYLLAAGRRNRTIDENTRGRLFERSK